MSETENRTFANAVVCPECTELTAALPAVDAVGVSTVSRRGFLSVLGRSAASLSLGGALLGGAGVGVRQLLAESAGSAKPDAAKPDAAKKATEDLLKELFASLTPEQKKLVQRPMDHGAEAGKAGANAGAANAPAGKEAGAPGKVAKAGRPGMAVATRLRIYNSPLGKAISEVYTKPQQELVERALKSLSSGDAGWRQFTRGGDFDNSGALENCGADFFGDPTTGPYAWTFTGHHLTVRCDGNFADNTAFGGPIYYGHTPNGYSDKNVFNFQTKTVLSFFDALSGDQQKKAIVTGTPGEGLPSVRIAPDAQTRPGLGLTDLSADQKTALEAVLRDLLAPFRKEDGDEVMAVIKATGGFDKLSLAFFRDGKMADDRKWHFWRVEGPGFVWNYRVLPHVHCFVNIAAARA